ncbi:MULTISPECIES: hypothetical protein [Sphingomonas]|uniref:Nucleoid associated protein NdpA n=1 Tax=Sphingomonas trueperi TaxID=53317 RepID=A0A7X6BCD9_9SPHN|nr:hypothetical protein [Sphingomonas sp. ABOLD]NJB96557.1 hypothetical protein [Sphingomonas trueperi]
MSILKAFAFLVPPGKGAGVGQPISGKEVGIGAGKLFEMLDSIFSGDASKHDFEIVFNHSATGEQYNECRRLFVEFTADATVENGLKIAQRLQNVSDHRSGLGLLFLISGTNGLRRRMVVSRFPTDQAVLAEVNEKGLNVEFLEQVFIKRLSSYKAVCLQHESPVNGFWKAMATDRQAGQSGEHISEYWLKEFLDADFSETPAAGTRRLAVALRKALKAHPNIDVKSELAHASSLASAIFTDKTISIEGFCEYFALSQSAKDAVRAQLSKSSLFGKNFKFDPEEFKVVAPFRTVEMSNGAILTAPNDEFENVFSEHKADNGIVTYSTVGRINDQRLARK